MIDTLGFKNKIILIYIFTVILILNIFSFNLDDRIIHFYLQKCILFSYTYTSKVINFTSSLKTSIYNNFSIWRRINKKFSHPLFQISKNQIYFSKLLKNGIKHTIFPFLPFFFLFFLTIKSSYHLFSQQKMMIFH